MKLNRMCCHLLVMMMMSCGYIEFSPWQADPPATNLNERNLERLFTNNKNKPRNGAFQFAVIGDTQTRPQAFRQTLDFIVSNHDVEFVVLAGDLTEHSLRREFKWITDIIEKSPIPVLAIPGNHDGLGKGSQIYQKTFGPLNYSFAIRGINFVMWNNNDYEWNSDLDWLDNALKTSLPAILIAHQPPYSGTLPFAKEERWQGIRNQLSLLASIHGHSHKFALYQEESGLAIFIVDRVRSINFGLVSIFGSRPSFQICRPDCVAG